MAGIGGGFGVGGGIGPGGIGGNIGFDAGAGAAPFLGGLGGLGGFGADGGLGFAPYVPSTPLGALEAFKGDLAIPIIAIGVALFLLLVIILAVKAALTWKLELLDSLVGNTSSNSRLRRDVTSGGSGTPTPQDQEQMSWLTKTVMAALENENCSQKILCQMGTYAKGTTVPSYMSWLEAFANENYKDSVTLFKNSAEGKLDCSQFKCGGSNSTAGPPQTFGNSNSQNSSQIPAQQQQAVHQDTDNNNVH